MKRILYIALAHISIICAIPTQNTQSNAQLNWQKLRENYKHNEACLKKSIKEQVLSDFLVAGCHENSSGQARMLMEIISRHMNENQSDHIKKESLAILLNIFCKAPPHAMQLAEKTRDEMTINSNDLSRAQEILNKVETLYDINYALPVHTCPLVAECNNISTNESPEDLKQKVENGVISESQIIQCMYMQTLIKLLAFSLVTDHNDPY